jgi:hypothetical protein
MTTMLCQSVSMPYLATPAHRIHASTGMVCLGTASLLDQSTLRIRGSTVAACGSIVQHGIIGLLGLLHGAHAFTMLECLRHPALQFSTIGAQASSLTLSVKHAARGPVMHAALCANACSACQSNACHVPGALSAAIAQWLCRNVRFAAKHHSEYDICCASECTDCQSFSMPGQCYRALHMHVSSALLTARLVSVLLFER